MYKVYVESKEFQGKRLVQQHQLINKILKEEVAEMHGIRISTAIPEAAN